MEPWDIEPSEVKEIKKVPYPYRKEIKEKDIKVILTKEQEDSILGRWQDKSKEPPSVIELLNICFPNQNFDGRSKEALVVKTFLVNHGVTQQELIIKETKVIELNDSQKEYITNNSNMKPVELARILFKNQNLHIASLEVKKVGEFYSNLDEVKSRAIEFEYRPPTNPERVVGRIKKFIKECENWDSNKLTPSQKKQVNSLKNYLHAYRFKHQVDSYESIEDKTLFETSFIKYCYDKEDLTHEEIDQYILLCSEIVVLNKIDRRIEMLQLEQNRMMDEDGKMSMTLVDAIKVAGEERNTCVKRQESLYKGLTQQRSDKLDSEIKDKASLLNLFNAWRNAETRQQILKIRERDKENLRKELHEIDEMPELMAKILGLSIDQIVES